MQITDEVVWGLADFAIAGTLLFGAGFTYELVTRKIINIIMYRVAIGAVLVLAFLLVWIELAVGIIGTFAQTFQLYPEKHQCLLFQYIKQECHY